ncbi:MAG: HU family DNA-binding protein [Chloroflexi bacterium]|nr:HU family DNA-binding protein [Chloroflexota bacterium]MCL5110228.1 HU family DNA-binding protein [Chloroflexota bacterium]
MNRVDLVGKIAASSGLTIKEANAALVAALDAVAAALAHGEEITLHGFGSFSVRQRQPRELVHPRTKERVRVAPAPTVHFSPATRLRRQLASDR